MSNLVHIKLIGKRSLNFEMSFWCLKFLPRNEQKQVDYTIKSICFGKNVGLKKSF